MSLMALLKAEKEAKMEKKSNSSSEKTSDLASSSAPTTPSASSSGINPTNKTKPIVVSTKIKPKSVSITSKNLKPVFQKLTVGHNKVLMSQGDIKSLGIKPGSLVCVSTVNNSSDTIGSNAILLAVWAREDVPVGSVLVPYLWNMNFHASSVSTNTKHDKFVSLSTDVSSLRTKPCSNLLLSIDSEFNANLSDDQLKALILNQAFLGYVRSLLQTVFLAPGLLFSCTWYGLMLKLSVVRVVSCGSNNSIDSNGSGQCQYQVTSQTNIEFDTGSHCFSNEEDNDDVSRSSDSKTVSVVDNSISTLSAATTSSFHGFAGYPEVVAEALKCLSFNLDGNNGSGRVMGSLLKPPKGMLIHGASGVGKTKLVHAIARFVTERNAIPGAVSYTVAHVPSTLLLSKYVGEAERKLQAIFTGAEAGVGITRAGQNKCTLVVIDDIDVLCPSRQANGTSDTQKRIVTSLLTLMDGADQYTDLSTAGSGTGSSASPSRVFVIGATNKPNVLDAALRRPGRFDVEIEVPVPTAPQREAILISVLSSMECCPPESTNIHVGADTLTRSEIHEVATEAHGLVGSDILQLCKFAVTCAHQRLLIGRQAKSETLIPHVPPHTVDVSELASQFTAMTVISVDHPASSTATATELPMAGFDCAGGLIKKDLTIALGKVTPSALREVVVEVPTVHWNDIGGMEAVKQSLKEVVEWPLLYASTFEALGLSCPKGVLLYGPPGCSKTLMAKAVATESSMNFLAVRGPELLSKYLGESEKAVQALFKRARAAAPSIVFFDEIDALASARGASNTGVNDRVLSQLLVELDGSSGYGSNKSRVIVIAATNRPDMLDSALLRPGRIDRKIYVSPPDASSRQQILESQLLHGKMSSRVRLSGSLEELVAMTEGFSGAEIVACCTEAAISVVNRVMEKGYNHKDNHLGNEYCADTVGSTDDDGFLTLEDVKLSVRAIKPQITPAMLSYYENFAEENVI